MDLLLDFSSGAIWGNLSKDQSILTHKLRGPAPAWPSMDSAARLEYGVRSYWKRFNLTRIDDSRPTTDNGKLHFQGAHRRGRTGGGAPEGAHRRGRTGGGAWPSMDSAARLEYGVRSYWKRFNLTRIGDFRPITNILLENHRKS